jgi:TolB-like protein/Flp pilus assembly protein TadD
MKRCPECRRDYYDDSLLYCLDDGTALLEGPAAVEEPATAILDTGDSDEQSTKTFDQDRSTGQASHGRATSTVYNKNSIIAGVVGIILVTALGLGSYFYYGRAQSKQIGSVAVMPFVNQGGNPDIEYLSEGMTETLISSLTQLPDLAVKPRSSVFRYKGKDTDAKTIGNELNVAAILNGSVVQRGSDMTLHVELIDTATETLIWSADYKRPLTNLATLQSEITRDVINNLKIKLNASDERKLAKNDTESGVAYQHYMQGLYFLSKAASNKDIETSIEYFQKAIAVDPNYARAYSGLADAYSLNVLGANRERMAKARAAAVKALALDEGLAEAHASLGRILSVDDYDQVGAEREMRRAVELNPNYGTGHHFLGDQLANMGRYEESRAAYRRALELEPFSARIYAAYGGSLTKARKYEEAVAQYNKALELDPNMWSAYGRLSVISEIAGKHAESVELRAKAFDLNGEGRTAALMRQSFAKGGWEGFHRFLVGEQRPPAIHFYHMAVAFTGLGEKEKAFEALYKSYDDHEISLVQSLNNDERLDPLRNDPRFHDLMNRVGFEK